MKTFLPVLFCCALVATAAQDSKPVAAADSVAALRETLARPEWNFAEVYSRIEACLNDGEAANAERLLRAEHDAAADDARKATLFGPWIWTSRATGSLNKLADEFTARRDANRDSSLAWLELEMVSEAAQTLVQAPKDYLMEAAKRDPGSAALREIIVSELEEHDLWREALAAVARWRKLDPTPRMTGALASLELLVGDDLHGWELAREVAATKADDSSALREVIEAACELREWRQAAALAAEGLQQWPDDVPLLCVRAAALEESGQEDAAVAACLRILALRDTKRPFKPEAHAFAPRSPFEIMPPGKAPEGAYDIAQLAAWSTQAYAYRQNLERWTREPDPTLYLPETEAGARAFALAHLNGMSRDGAKVPEGAVSGALAASGHASVGVVTTLQAGSLSAEEIGKMLLRDHAEDEALFAWWLLSEYERWRTPAFAPVLEQCAKLFAERFPALAFHAAIELAKIPGVDQARHQALALAQFRVLAQAEPKVARSVAYSLGHQIAEWPTAHEWRAAMISVLERGTKEAPEAWMTDGSPGDGLSRYECGLALLRVLSVDHQWEAYAQFLDKEAKRPPPLDVLLLRPPYGNNREGTLLLSDGVMSFPNALLRWPHSITETLGIFYDQRTRVQHELPADKSWVEHLQDPLLKITAKWRIGDTAGANAAIAQRLHQPGTTLADWWLAAWLAWEGDTVFPGEASEQLATRTAAERFAQAAEFPAEGTARLLLDAALLRSVLALKERPQSLLDAAHAAARRFCSATLPYQAEDLKAAFGFLGFAEEAGRIDKVPIAPYPTTATAYSKPMWPATTLDRYRSRRRWDDDERSAKTKPEREAAARRALQKLHHSFPGSYEFLPIGTFRDGTKDEDLLGAVAALATPRENAPPRELLRAGQDFELLGKPEIARKFYESALRRAPQLSEARARLTLLVLDDDADAAEKMIETLPDHACASVVDALVQRVRPEAQEKPRANAMRVLATWLTHLATTKKPLPRDCVMPLQLVMLEKKFYPEELCAAALGIREVADDALARIGEEAMRRGQPLAESATLAKELLRAKAAWGLCLRRDLRKR